jgi:hypothetical protein
VRIRRATGSGASPLPDRNKNNNEQDYPSWRRVGTVVPSQGVGDRCAGTLPLIVAVPSVVSMVSTLPRIGRGDR